jgi:hypothetical protein
VRIRGYSSKPKGASEPKKKFRERLVRAVQKFRPYAEGHHVGEVIDHCTPVHQ